jgi:hypothetical protein
MAIEIDAAFWDDPARRARSLMLELDRTAEDLEHLAARWATEAAAARSAAALEEPGSLTAAVGPLRVPHADTLTAAVALLRSVIGEATADVA